MAGFEPTNGGVKVRSLTTWRHPKGEKYNLNILTYNAGEYLKTSNNFDIIVMYDVIEHLDNPFQVLNDISKKLNPNGILIFTTMNMDAFVPKLMGRRYPWIIFMHKFYFTNKSIKKLEYLVIS